MDLCTWYYSSCSKVFFIIYFKIKKFVTIVQQCNNHQMHYGLNHHYQLKEENNLLLWNVSDEWHSYSPKYPSHKDSLFVPTISEKLKS